MKYRERKTIEAIQFDPTQRPWPRCVNAWPNGYLWSPKDSETWPGYVYTSLLGEVHIQAGDWIIDPGIEGASAVLSNEAFEAMTKTDILESALVLARIALQETVQRIGTNYDWNADPDSVTLAQGKAFEAMTKVNAQ